VPILTLSPRMNVDQLLIAAEKPDVELLRSCLIADRKIGNNALDFEHSDTSLAIGESCNRFDSLSSCEKTAVWFGRLTSARFHIP
jgi:hypothetical protein